MSESVESTQSPISDKPKDVVDLEKAYSDVETHIKTVLEGKWDGRFCMNVMGLLNFLNGGIAQIKAQYQAHPWVQEQAAKQAVKSAVDAVTAPKVE